MTDPTFKPTWLAISAQARNHRPEQPSQPLQRRRWLRMAWSSQPWTQSRVQPPGSKSPSKLNPSKYGKLSKCGFWSKVGSPLYPAKGQTAQNRQLWTLYFLNSSYHGNLRSPEIQRMEGQGLTSPTNILTRLQLVVWKEVGHLCRGVLFPAALPSVCGKRGY